MAEYQSEKQLIELLLMRLERISADSYLAHRASGIRGALLKALEKSQKGNAFNEDSLQPLIELSFLILEQAAS